MITGNVQFLHTENKQKITETTENTKISEAKLHKKRQQKLTQKRKNIKTEFQSSFASEHKSKITKLRMELEKSMHRDWS